MTLSESAAQLLRELVQDHRHGITSGDIVYGDVHLNQEVLDDLAELDRLADTARTRA